MDNDILDALNGINSKLDTIIALMLKSPTLSNNKLNVAQSSDIKSEIQDKIAKARRQAEQKMASFRDGLAQ